MREWVSPDGRMRLYNMDCCEFMRGCADGAYGLSIVDPPYGLERFKSGGSHINKYGSHSADWNNTKPSSEYFDHLFRVCHNQIIWGGNNFNLPPSEYFVVWQKGSAVDFSFAMCEQAWTNIKKPAKLFVHLHASTTESRIHPTQKPVALYRWLLQNYAKPGDRLLDTHVGSASSFIAAWEKGYEIHGTELDPDYYETAVARIEKAMQQQQLPFDTPPPIPQHTEQELFQPERQQ